MVSGVEVFISYCVADGEAAAQITTLLRRSGLNAWRDVDGVRLRAKHDREILSAIEEAFVVVLVLSHRAAARPWVRAEIAHALARGTRVVVIRIGPCDIPDWAGPSTVVDIWSAADADDRIVWTISRIVRRLKRRGRDVTHPEGIRTDRDRYGYRL